MRIRPDAPAAGICVGPAPDSARATARALSAPLTTSQMSLAPEMTGAVIDSRIGGGFGAPRTATTVRSVS